MVLHQSPYVDMSARDLRLTLLADPVDAMGFHVLEAEKMKAWNLEVEARIIGASHWVTFRTPHVGVHELFSCHNVREGRVVKQYGPLSQSLGPVDLLLFDQLEYSFQWRAVSLRSNDPEATEIRDSALQAKEREGHIGLIHDFPSKTSLPAPRTIVWACLEPGLFQIATIHSYPNEDSLVITRTRIFTECRGKA